jgi:hypothetical protein
MSQGVPHKGAVDAAGDVACVDQSADGGCVRLAFANRTPSHERRMLSGGADCAPHCPPHLAPEHSALGVTRSNARDCIVANAEESVRGREWNASTVTQRVRRGRDSTASSLRPRTPTAWPWLPEDKFSGNLRNLSVPRIDWVCGSKEFSHLDVSRIVRTLHSDRPRPEVWLWGPWRLLATRPKNTFWRACSTRVGCSQSPRDNNVSD